MDDYIGKMFKQEQNKYFCIDSVEWGSNEEDDLYWQEIPHSLYSELVKFGRGSK